MSAAEQNSSNPEEENKQAGEKQKTVSILNDYHPFEILEKYREKLARSGEESIARRSLVGLLDSGSFAETGDFVGFDPEDLESEKKAGDGISCGFGEINERRVAVVLFDSSIKKGTFSRRNCRILKRFIDRTRRRRLPLVLIVDSNGIRPGENVTGLAETAGVMEKLDSCGGVIPRICLVVGRCRHTAAMMAGLSDVVIGAAEAEPPDSGEKTTLKGEGFYDLYASDIPGAVELTVRCLNYLPDNSSEDSYVLQGEPPDISRNPGEIVPADKSRPYDVKKVIRSIFDGKSFLETREDEAKNIVTGFARLDGRAVGVVANQPRFRAGTLDGAAGDKAADFIRFCDTFNLPVVLLVDLPGFLPASEREQTGMINRTARLFTTCCRLEVPLVTLITRKAYDTAYTVMGAPTGSVDYLCAWPRAEVAVTEKETGNEEPDPEFYQFGDPWEAAGEGYIDKIIEPAETREILVGLVTSDKF